MRQAATNLAWTLALTLVVASGCGNVQTDATTGHHEERTTGQQLRPTDPADPLGYEGASVQSYASEEGHFRVWWSEEGGHAPPSADEDGDGVPDYVEMVAEVAEDIAAKLESEGWKLALSDDIGGGEPPGGDARFDIYLIDFRAGDGQFSRDRCKANFSDVQHCAGHFRLENDFAGLAYPSLEYAVRVVTSHEYFHAVQAAYVSEVPHWWSEGTATWFEEYYYAEQNDFERLTSLYFEDHTRTLNDRGRGPADGFAYGASIFVYFLELQIGDEGLKAVFERLATGEELVDALEAEVSGSLESLESTFELFAVYNLFTGSRAVDSSGYPEAARFAEVTVESRDIDGPLNWNLDADPLAARYLELTFDEAITLRKTAIEGFVGQPSMLAVNATEFDQSSAIHEITNGAPVEFAPDMSPLYVVVANGDTEQDRAATLQIRMAPDDMSDPDDPGDDNQQEETDGGGEGGCSTGEGRPTTLLLSLVFGLFLFARRARAHSSSLHSATTGR
jgi:hypothetical protein